MNNRALGFFSLLGVIGASIVFGMVVGGRLNAPRVAFAAPPGPVALAPAALDHTPVTSFADVVEATMPAVVSVTSRQVVAGEDAPPRRRGERDELWRWFFGPEDSDPRRDRPSPQLGQGSGFVISTDGYVLTNHHVVDEADQVVVGFQDGNEVEAQVVGVDPSIDLALLKIEGMRGIPALPLGDSDSLRVGEWVIAIGNPLEYEQTVTVGVVSAKNRRVPIGSTDRNGLVSFIQTDAAINFGNSGGPLLDGRGNVVGINTAITRVNFAEGIGFALPINQARGVIEQLRERGYVRRGYIGISMNNNGIDSDARDYYGLPDARGVIIDDVTRNGPAEKAGLRKDDIIRSVDGRMVEDNDDLIARISSMQPGETVRLGLFRGGRQLEVSATLAERESTLQASRRTPPREPEAPVESSGLGITVENLASRNREQLGLDEDQGGVIVSDVEFGSLASQKGIGPPMVITSVNDRRVRDIVDWSAIIEDLDPGEPVKINALLPADSGPRNVTIFLRAPR